MMHNLKFDGYYSLGIVATSVLFSIIVFILRINNYITLAEAMISYIISILVCVCGLIFFELCVLTHIISNQTKGGNQ